MPVALKYHTGKEYENILVKNDKFSEETVIALGLVKNYVKNNKLLIVGGMAIDLSLRLKGSYLYDDNVLPDYDFYSPEHHKDAYKIAELLNQAGLKNISVINANHTSTMRVRVNYTVVADVTYIPPNIYSKLPFLIYRDIRIIHPHYQLIDQHRALSLPYENPPWEVITHRWKKDTTRYDMIYKYYPLDDYKKTSKIKLQNEKIISSIMFQNQCFSGFAGLLYWIDVAEKLGFKNPYPSLGSFYYDVAGFILQVPVDSHGITIYSNNILSLYDSIKNQEKIKDERQYKRFLDKFPHKIILDNTYELFDNKGSLLSAHKLDMGIYIANIQNIMLYMLTNIILLKNIHGSTRGDTFHIGYLTAREIVKWASVQYKTQPDIVYPFLPDVNVYGDKEISDSYINSKRQFLEKTKELPSENLQPRLIFPETFIDGKIPKKYYSFKASESKILQFDGSETETYFNRVYI